MVCVLEVEHKVELLTLSLLLNPTVDLCSAPLWGPDEINGLQVSMVVLLCGVKEFLKSQRKSIQSNTPFGSLHFMKGVNPKPTERKLAVLSP